MLHSYLSHPATQLGRTVVDRLIHIIQSCPTLAPQAFGIAIEHVQRLRDTSLYNQLIATYEQVFTAVSSESPIPTWQEFHQYDQRWVEETNRRNSEEKAKLEVELKTYTSNMIKESIRVRYTSWS